MIKHIVLFKLAPFAEGGSRDENALYLKKELENLPSFMPELLKMEVVLNKPGVSDANYDLMLTAEFEDLQGLNIYINHPEHLKIGSFMSKVRTSRVAIDHEF